MTTKTDTSAIVRELVLSRAKYIDSMNSRCPDENAKARWIAASRAYLAAKGFRHPMGR